MMLAGYRNVIATMWSIFDEDGPQVAETVYAELLRDGKADHNRAAYALHRAIQQLRLSGAPLMAWIPFIHMGLSHPSLPNTRKMETEDPQFIGTAPIERCVC